MRLDESGWLFAVVLLAAISLTDLALAQPPACSNCLACETCAFVSLVPTCLDTCNTPATGLYCDATAGGTCAPFCPASSCLTWNVARQQCVSGCAGCTSCAGNGLCQPDESLRNPCGKCPDEPGYELCYQVPGDLVTSNCIAVQGSSVPLLYRLAHVECRMLELRTALDEFPCMFDSDCVAPARLVTCDPCKQAYCDIDMKCNVRHLDPWLYPVEFNDNKCGPCLAYDNNCTLARPCAIDYCLDGGCVHLLGAPCTY